MKILELILGNYSRTSENHLSEIFVSVWKSRKTLWENVPEFVQWKINCKFPEFFENLGKFFPNSFPGRIWSKTFSNSLQKGFKMYT